MAWCRQNGRRFADDVFTCLFLNENVGISLEISLTFVPEVWINNTPSLVHVMTWRRLGDKPLSEPMMVCLPTHVCVTRLQWVKGIIDRIPYRICVMSISNPYGCAITRDSSLWLLLFHSKNKLYVKIGTLRVCCHIVPMICLMYAIQTYAIRRRIFVNCVVHATCLCLHFVEKRAVNTCGISSKCTGKNVTHDFYHIRRWYISLSILYVLRTKHPNVRNGNILRAWHSHKNYHHEPGWMYTLHWLIDWSSLFLSFLTKYNKT